MITGKCIVWLTSNLVLVNFLSMFKFANFIKQIGLHAVTEECLLWLASNLILHTEKFGLILSWVGVTFSEYTEKIEMLYWLS